MRIDEKRLPTAFKCATVSKEELPSLRKIKNIIRSGRVESLEKDKIVFKDKRFVLAMLIFFEANPNKALQMKIFHLNQFCYLYSEIAASPQYLYIDCTSNGLGKRPAVPIFNGKTICLQAISQCQQVYSAAALGAVEARFSNDDKVNQKKNIYKE